MVFHSVRRAIRIMCCAMPALFGTSGVFAQIRPGDSAALHTGYARALEVYHHALVPETRLYKGVEYAEYAYTIKVGHPFFDIDHMQKGRLFYDGVAYADLLLIYDLVRNQVVINDPYNTYKIALINDRLDRFSIGDHLFVHIRDSIGETLRPGFYEQLYEGGRVSLLKKERKTIQEDPSAPIESRQYIAQSASYYLRIGQRYSIVNTRKALLRAMQDQKSALRKYIRSLHLDMHTNKDRIFVQAVAWYDRHTQQ